MKHRYKNSFHNPNGVDGAGRPFTYGPEYYETNSEPIEHAGHLIYERQEFGFPCFDVVLDGVCVAQRAGMSSAEQIAEARLKMEMESVMTTRETNVRGHRVLECEERRQKLVYVNERMVTTGFDETVAILECGKAPEFESEVASMNRVVAAVFGRAV